MDSFTWEILNKQGVGKNQISRLGKEQGYRIKMEIASPDCKSEEELTAFIQSEQPEVVFLSSLLPFSASKVVSHFPEILFIQENLVEYDYENVFFRAGAAAAQLICCPSFKDLLQLESGLHVPKAGILVSTDNNTVNREISAFRRGFETKADPSRLVYKVIGSTGDRVKTRRLLEKMKEEGVVITFLKAYTLNSYCLEFFRKEGGFAIAEDWWDGESGAEVVIISIREEFIGSLQKILVAIKNNELGYGNKIKGSLQLEIAPVISGFLEGIE